MNRTTTLITALATTTALAGGYVAGSNPTARPNVVHLDDYRDGGDDADAFDRALAECKGPCNIRLGPGPYRFQRALRLCRRVRLSGLGRGFTAIHTTGSTFAKARFRWDCLADGYGGHASGSVFEGFDVIEQGHHTPDENRVAFDINTNVELHDIGVRGFRHAVLADCGMLRRPKAANCAQTPDECRKVSNCNRLHLDGVHASGQDHAAVVFQGPDANAGLISRSSFVQTCRAADLVAEFVAEDPTVPPANLPLYRNGDGAPRCGAIIDSSFLGNTWIGNHVAYASDGLNRYSDYWAEDPKGNQRTVILGNYAEGSLERDSFSPVSQNTLVLGGAMLSRGGYGLRDRALFGRVSLVAPTIKTDSTGRTLNWTFQDSTDFVLCTADSNEMKCKYRNSNRAVRQRWELR